MAKKVDIKFNVDTVGKDKINGLVMSTQQLEKATKAAARASADAKKQYTQDAIGYAAIKNTLDGLDNAMRSIMAITTDLTAAYTVQAQAETQLATVMRQRMAATEDDIDSIKRLASAQQKIGVIGDEVQLAGAQQVATFLTMRSSLAVLLPAMNDLVAQQKGLKATGADAIAVANLMGKAMQGQTSALRRVGITFSATQEEVMKTGTEMERAAMLAQIITDNVGHMNAELAKTDAGKLQQKANALGDMKEKMGELVMKVQPYLTVFAQLTTASTGVYKLANGFKLLYQAVIPTVISASKSAKMLKLSADNAQNYALKARAAAVATSALKVALKGLLITTLVGAAIVALTSALEWFINRGSDVADVMDGLSESEQRMRMRAEEAAAAERQLQETVNNARAQMETYLIKLKNFKGSKEEERRIVKELNGAYGETMGYFSSAADWYRALTANSKIYCRQLEIEARMRLLANEAARLEQEKHNYRFTPDGKPRLPERKAPAAETKAPAASQFYNPLAQKQSPVQAAAQGYLAQNNIERRQKPATPAGPVIDAYALQDQLVKNADEQLAATRQQMDDLAKEMSELQYPVIGSSVQPDLDSIASGDKVLIENAKNTEQLRNNLQYYEQELDRCEATDTERIAALRAGKEATEAQLRVLDQLTGREKSAAEAARENSRALIENAETLNELTNNLQYYDEELAKCHPDEEERIKQLKEGKQATEELIAARRKQLGLEKESSATAKYDPAASTLGAIEDNIRALQEQLQNASIENAAAINQEILAWQRKADAIRNAGTEARKAGDMLREGWGNIKGIGSGVDSLTSALEGNGNAWQKITGVVDGALQMYDGIMGVVAIVTALRQATALETTAETTKAAAVGASTAAKLVDTATSETAAAAQIPVVAANKAAAQSYMQLAAAAYYAAHAYIPFAGYAIATGFISASEAVVEAIGAMPFANGGIVSGPTFGLIGEYPGASNNPEVVAPLNRLKELLEPAPAMGGTVRFHIKGRDLEGVLDNRNKYNDRL